MPDDNQLPQDDEELRRQIRAEIEERDRQRQMKSRQNESARSANEEAEKRRRIYQEELRKYYQDKPGYRQVVREDGETDWVPEHEARRDAELFEEVLEDPDEARSRMKWIVMLAAAVVIVFAVGIYMMLHENKGNIQVTCNMRGAEVILDTTPLGQYTDYTIREVPAGEHVVTVALDGYKVQGDPVRHLRLKGGKTEQLSFVLTPDSTAKPAEHK